MLVMEKKLHMGCHALLPAFFYFCLFLIECTSFRCVHRATVELPLITGAKKANVLPGMTISKYI